jgi:hypothetical protein
MNMEIEMPEINAAAVVSVFGRLSAWLRTLPSIASSGNAFRYARRYRVNPICTHTCRRAWRSFEAGNSQIGSRMSVKGGSFDLTRNALRGEPSARSLSL